MTSSTAGRPRPPLAPRAGAGRAPSAPPPPPTAPPPATAPPCTLIGRNLGGTPAPDLSVDGRPLERRTVTLETPPARDPDPASPALGHLPSPAASRRGFEYALHLPSGTSNPVFVAEPADPVVLEQEPNDD